MAPGILPAGTGSVAALRSEREQDSWLDSNQQTTAEGPGVAPTIRPCEPHARVTTLWPLPLVVFLEPGGGGDPHGKGPKGATAQQEPGPQPPSPQGPESWAWGLGSGPSPPQPAEGTSAPVDPDCSPEGHWSRVGEAPGLLSQGLGHDARGLPGAAQPQ